MYVYLFIELRKMYMYSNFEYDKHWYNECIWYNFVAILDFSIKFELVLEFKIDVEYFGILLNLWLLWDL